MGKAFLHGNGGGSSVKQATGTITFYNGSATLSLGFSPDVVSIDLNNLNSGYRNVMTADFSYSNMIVNSAGKDTNLLTFKLNRNGNSVTISGKQYTTAWAESNVTGSYTYKAYKFTK